MVIEYVNKFFDTLEVNDFKREKGYSQIHLKRDGYCLLAIMDNKGELHMYTRTPRRQWSGQEWARNLRENLKPGEVVCGELFVPGKTSSDVRSVLCEKPRFEGVFEAFYTPNVHTFRDYYDWCTDRNITPISSVESIDSIPDGYEGFVLKNSYHPNKKYAWMRYKPVHSIDLRITGFDVRGQGKNFKLIRSAICKSDTSDLTVSVGTLTDSVRRSMTNNPEKWIGRVVEIHYQKVSGMESLRHPRFIRVRDDKDTTD